MLVKNKVILVTGAGNGIGKEIALNLLARGAKVAAVDVREEFLSDLKEQTKDNAKNIATFVADITDREAVMALPKKVISELGAIDGIINNAGIIQPFVKVRDLEFPAVEKVMNVNFYGTLNMIKAFLPELLKRPTAHIVNVSSMGGFLPVPGQSVYGASKAAVKLMTEGLYAELKDTSVQVSVVFPGATSTNITKNSGVAGPTSAEADAKAPKIPMTAPSVAAETIVRGMEKNKFQIFIGNDSKLMNFLYKINPKFATNLIASQMKSLLQDK